jgi:predicted small secreted protein
MKRQLLPLIALLVAACGTTTSGVGDIADLGTLTETYGCGTGFWIGNADQTTALRIAYQGEGPPPASVTLPDPAWDAEMVDGRDLYANWCDDVIEPGEPEPQEARVLPVVSGELEVLGVPPAQFQGGSLTVRATDLVIDIGDGKTHTLGDVEIENSSWGFFAG